MKSYETVVAPDLALCLTAYKMYRTHNHLHICQYIYTWAYWLRDYTQPLSQHDMGNKQVSLWVTTQLSSDLQIISHGMLKVTISLSSTSAKTEVMLKVVLVELHPN